MKQATKALRKARAKFISQPTLANRLAVDAATTRYVALMAEAPPSNRKYGSGIRRPWSYDADMVRSIRPFYLESNRRKH